METVLYHPEHGYYSSARPKLGRDGDFVTSPEVHPAFAYTVSRLVTATFEATGGPGMVIEAGAGAGTMAADILAVLPTGTRYRIIEVSPGLEAAQRQRLAEYTGHIQWMTWDAAPPVEGPVVVITNELFDALPWSLNDRQ